jgi:hypothetical protein
LKEFWAAALNQTVEPASQDGGSSPSMHQNSLNQFHGGHGRLRGRVRYPRKIFFGGNLYLLLMPKGGSITELRRVEER